MEFIIFIVLMIIITVFEGKRFYNEVSKNPYVDINSANIISSFGVFFTFCGISYGLLYFNTNEIEKSVPYLLEGMKTAFFTSIIGMLASIFCKLFQDIKQREAEKTKKIIMKDADISDLIEYLHKRDEQIYNQRQEFQNKLCDEIKYANEQMINEFHNFTKDMAENNTKAFIESLNDTIKNFNDKIQEQFGENFKQLNEAVSKLLIWQENYKTTIEKTNQNQMLIYKTINNASTSLDNIEKSALSLIEAADSLKNLIVTSAVYSKRLNDEIKILQEVANNAQNIAPSIHNLVETANKDLKDYSQKALMIVNEYLEDVVNETNNNINQVCENMTNVISNSIDNSISQVANYSIVTNQTIGGLTEQVKNTTQEIYKNIKESQLLISKFTTEAINDVNTIYQIMNEKSIQQQEEINNSIILINGLFESAVNDSKSLTNALNINIKTINRDIESISASVVETSKRQQESIQQAANKLSTSSLEITEHISAKIKSMIEVNNNNLIQSSKNLNENLNKTLDDSLMSLGKNLVRINNKFADNYTLIIKHLQELFIFVERSKSGAKNEVK